MKLFIETIFSYIKPDHQNDQDFITTVLIPCFSVKIEGLKYIPGYRKGAWDEYKHYLTQNGKFATGFLPLMLKYLNDNNVEVEINDRRDSIPEFHEDFSDVIGTFTLRSYQVDAVKSVNNYLNNKEIYFPRGIIDGATNAGKNLVIAGIHENIKDSKTLLLLHSKDIYMQAIEYFTNIFRSDVYGIDSNSTKSRVLNIGRFTIAMVQTLHNNMAKSTDVLETIKNYFNVVIVDECHHAGSRTYISTLQNINAGVRIMVSGTPLKNDDKVKNLDIIANSGTKLYSISNKVLIDHKVSRKPVINLHLSNVENKLTFFTYAEESQLAIENATSRLEKIGDLIEAKLDKYFLVFFQKRHHGKLLYSYLTNRFPKLDIVMIHGDSPNRKQAVDDFSKSKIQILISSLILKEGINLPNIDELILANGGKSLITVTQLIGRALRAKQGHDTVQVHDFYDMGKYIESHSKRRIKFYESEGFEIIAHYEHKTDSYAPTQKARKIHI